MNPQRIHLIARAAGFIAVMAVAAILAGCNTTPPTAVHQPMTVRPAPRNDYVQNGGAIYQAGAARPLFEDRRARNVGDTIVINISERTQAAKKSGSSAERKDDVSVGIPTMVWLPLSNSLKDTALTANGANTFAGKGASSADNNFTGTITVTVIEVLPNGNLLVSGEKQVAINQGNEYIRFSGVVNPTQVTGANTVQSTQVADARIEYRASGYIDEAQVMGWLGRFFLTFLPL